MIPRVAVPLLKRANRYFGLQSLRLSTTHAVVTTAGRDLPSNLKLADVSVLDDEPEPLVPEIERYFPRHPSKVPASVPVLRFGAAEGSYEPLPPLTLEKDVFGAAYRADIVNEVVRYLRNKRRQPKCTKRITDISGSGKKPHPQKRQGRAQAGNKRNSVWRGGQKAHGPKLRDYSIDLPKKMRAMGMMVVLAAKLREGNLIVVDSLEGLESHRTRDLLQKLAVHGITEESRLNTLLADCYDSVQENRELELASRNVPWLLKVSQTKLDVYNLMQKPRLVITAPALMQLQQRVLAQHRCTGRRAKYSSAMAQYQQLVEAGLTLQPAHNTATTTTTANATTGEGCVPYKLAV